MEKKIWILMDDRMGSNNQARGVAEALGWNFVEKKLSYNCLAGLPNFLIGASLRGIDEQSRQKLLPPYPDLIIAASRRTASVARWIKKQTENKIKIVQIMHPGRVGLKEFDRVFVSDHDRHKVHGHNIFYVTGCAHRITSQTLKEERDKWQEKFIHLPRPWTAVVVGGTYKGHEFTKDNARDFARHLAQYKRKIGGSILITDSRRTGNGPQDIIMDEIKKIPTYRYLWGKDKGENPYMGFLSCADDIVVTGDSVSMCCEACGTGKQVQFYGNSQWLDKKHQKFLESMYAKKFAFPLGADIPQGTLFQSYNPSKRIALEIERLFK